MRGEKLLSPYQAFLQSALQDEVQKCWQKWSQEALSKRDIKMLGTCTKALFLIWLYNVLICGARYMSNMKLSCEVRKNINKDSGYYSTKRGVQPSWSRQDSPGICLEIPSPDQHTIGIIKITILTSVLIFSKTGTRCILRASKRSASPCSPWSRYDFESRERPGRVGDRSCRLHPNLYKNACCTVYRGL